MTETKIIKDKSSFVLERESLYDESINIWGQTGFNEIFDKPEVTIEDILSLESDLYLKNHINFILQCVSIIKKLGFAIRQIEKCKCKGEFNEWCLITTNGNFYACFMLCDAETNGLYVYIVNRTESSHYLSIFFESDEDGDFIDSFISSYNNISFDTSNESGDNKDRDNKHMNKDRDDKDENKKDRDKVDDKDRNKYGDKDRDDKHGDNKHIDNDAKNNIYGEMPIDKELYINDVINNRIKKREIKIEEVDRIKRSIEIKYHELFILTRAMKMNSLRSFFVNHRQNIPEVINLLEKDFNVKFENRLHWKCITPPKDSTRASYIIDNIHKIDVIVNDKIRITFSDYAYHTDDGVNMYKVDAGVLKHILPIDETSITVPRFKLNLKYCLDQYFKLPYFIIPYSGVKDYDVLIRAIKLLLVC